MSTTTKPTGPVVSNDFLIRGTDYLAGKPDFKLVGRDHELEELTKVLTMESGSSVLLVGPSGVGCSAISVGLQASKDNPNTPYDVVGKRMYWLDTDGLFASGNTKEINDAFQRTLARLGQSKDSVLVIDDMRDFVDACNSHGCTNLINALMRDIRGKKFQAIMETADDDLEVVLKCHSDMKENFQVLDVEPPDAESLKLILEQASLALEKHHKIKISDEARAAAIELTMKYRVRDMGLSRAQPARSITLLDRALTTFRLEAHARNPHLDELEERLRSAQTALADPNYSTDNGGKSREELEALKVSLESDIAEINAGWDERQKKIRSIYKDLRTAEERIRQLEDERETTRVKEEQDRAASQTALETEIGKLENKAKKSEDDLENLKNYKSALTELHNIGESNEMTRLNEDIRKYEGYAQKSKKDFEALTSDINDGLVLDRDQVLNEFSIISGVPVSKLTQDEKAKLQSLEGNLGNRVWGQEDAVRKLANEVLIAKAGLQDPDKPQGAFLYLGPSGVGKTELAKALAAELLDDEKALLRFDMSEYQEKHALAKLIGAPPGYEGYEAGGILTNEMRRNPRRIILFDEIEKAQPDIFLLFLQILDDARLTDNRGLTVSFRDSIIIMTSNAGKEHFINEDLTFEQASELAMKKLGETLPPELLNRFNGRQNIVCFKSLPLEVIEKIAKREMAKLDKKVSTSKPELGLAMEDKDIAAMCKDNYVPVQGARGIQGYINGHIKSAIAKTVLFNDGAKGVMQVEYEAGKGVTVHPPVEAPGKIKPEEKPKAKEAAPQFASASQPA